MVKSLERKSKSIIKSKTKIKSKSIIKSKSKSIIKTKSKTKIKSKSIIKSKFNNKNKLIALGFSGSLATLAAIIASSFEINKVKDKENLKQINKIQKQEEIIRKNIEKKDKYLDELLVLQRQLFNTKDKSKRLIINEKMLKLHKQNPN